MVKEIEPQKVLSTADIPSVKPEFARVTDREIDLVLELLGLEKKDFKLGQRVVISGSGFHLNFENQLHDLGLELAIIDQSLGFTSSDYTIKVELFSEAQYEVATYALKEGRPHFGNKNDQEFDFIQQKRLERANEICFKIITERVPSPQLEELKEIDWFIDCIGPGHYVQKSEIKRYLNQFVKTLRIKSGTAVIYPISNRIEPWLQALTEQEGIVWEEYTPNELHSQGVKIRRTA